MNAWMDLIVFFTRLLQSRLPPEIEGLQQPQLAQLASPMWCQNSSLLLQQDRSSVAQTLRRCDALELSRRLRACSRDAEQKGMCKLMDLPSCNCCLA